MGLCKTEYFWHAPITRELLGRVIKKNLMLTFQRGLFFCSLPSSLRLPEGKFGRRLKAPAAVVTSLLKRPVRLRHSPPRSLGCQIRGPVSAKYCERLKTVTFVRGTRRSRCSAHASVTAALLAGTRVPRYRRSHPASVSMVRKQWACGEGTT